MTGQVRAIDCPNCGAGLDVLGGGRVTTQVCGYCGAALDATDAYRVLAVYAGMERPASPFRLGMEGALAGATFTLIGTLGLVERDGGREWRWTDHMLYSPTHGYAWLTVEDGHVLFTRKVRDWPEGGFLTPRGIERMETPPTRAWRGRRYAYFASSTWIVDFAEGAFNYRPARGETGGTVSLMPPGVASDMLSYVSSGGGREREVEVTRYAPEAAAAFGAEAPTPHGVHPLQPHRDEAGAGFYKAWFTGMTAAALAWLVWVTALPAPPQTVYQGRAAGLPFETSVPIRDAARPVKVRVETDARDEWAVFGIEVLGPDGTQVARVARDVSFYRGVEDGESWSEGSRATTLGFRPAAQGDHTLRLTLHGESPPQAAAMTLDITLQEGRTSLLWLGLATLAFAAATAWCFTGAMRHRARRWAGSDWEEED